jgi:flagellar basal body-associated protein FliL
MLIFNEWGGHYDNLNGKEITKMERKKSIKILPALITILLMLITMVTVTVWTMPSAHAARASRRNTQSHHNSEICGSADRHRTMNENIMREFSTNQVFFLRVCD